MRPPRPAVQAFPTGYQERCNDRITGLHRSDAFTNFLNITGRFMATDEREYPPEVSTDNVDITMANGRRGHADFYLTLLRWVNIYLLNHQWFAKFITDCSFQFNLLELKYFWKNVIQSGVPEVV
jgi:hypothetical protein